jgi:6-pyruvoyltetrahydropterin/6-carboxytetrahydropterin synthase
MLITKEFTFDMAHRLPNHAGKCWNIHGHTYKMQVTIKGEVGASEGSHLEGMVLDFSEVKHHVKKFIDNHLDHYYLSDSRDTLVTDFLVKNKFAVTAVNFVPTAENMAEWIFNKLDSEFKTYFGVELYSIKIWETPTSFAEFRASAYKNN